MKFVSILDEGKDKAALLVGKSVYTLERYGLPATMAEFLNGEDHTMDKAREYSEDISKDAGKYKSSQLDSVTLLAPVPYPTSCRDGYAFRQHVSSARRNRGVEMIPEFDEYPIFYFTNHNGITGGGEIKLMPDHFQKLDFELEAAVVIGRRGRNVRAGEADKYIAGYMIMNDFSARTLQMEEMKLNLGPAKGKDFATAIGPFFVTPDELKSSLVAAKEGHTGNSYKLGMKAFVNGKQVSEGNMGDMDWTFAELIERVAYGVDIFPGDVIGSGTVGTGCFLELNGTGLLHDKNFPVQWLQEGDEIELTIDMLGSLKNTIRKEKTDFSILSQKK
ncbi:MAG: fumarylacetoacetate hydrolase family protein [Bacteroidota bacterium]|nr:fumarylacetoacetate hydrolase family protein [Bacteroidota bacterium]